MEDKYYIQDWHKLAFYKEQATAEFWDQHWDKTDLATRVRAITSDQFFVPLANKYLPKGAKILEGGSGAGGVVHGLHHHGYDAIGVDYAQETIKALQAAVPELKFQVGDLRKLEFPDNSFDGYVSGGVIEHLWDGYAPLTSEMARVVKPGGYLFITFPYMSPLRQLKAILHLYPHRTSAQQREMQNRFYQFALPHRHVISDLEKLGFKLVEKQSVDGLKGFKDEFAPARRLVQGIYDGKFGASYKGLLDSILRTFAGHMMLLVLQRQ